MNHIIITGTKRDISYWIFTCIFATSFKNFTKGTTSNFLLSTAESLGEITNLGVSLHENPAYVKGVDEKGKIWHLDRVIIADLQTKEK